MAHKRQKIRDDIVATLIAASTAAGNRVYPTRSKPLFDNPNDSDLPAILVYTSSETVLEVPPESHIVRDLTLSVEAVDFGDETTAIDVKLDNIAEEIEAALNSHTSPCSIWKYFDLKGTEIDTGGEGDKIRGAIRLQYNVNYSTRRAK